jgi:hypothetical protein
MINSEKPTVEIQASDELGFIYGIYEISRRFLRIKPFWFWMDEDIVKLDSVIIGSDFTYKSEPFAISYRGWFINDEVLLSAWSVDRDNDKPWELAFVADELAKVIEHGGKDFWIINSSNIKPHVYFLDLIAKMWK